MYFFRLIYATVLEALFPVSRPETELFSYSPEQAFGRLPAATDPPIPHAYSVFAYKDKRVTRLVWQIKYMKSAKAVTIGGYALYGALCNKILPELLTKKTPPKKDSAFSEPIFLIPIPITSKRRRERGFNQCELLLDEIGHLDTEKRFTLRPDLIVRVHHNTRQTLKGRSERLESAKKIFAVNKIVTEDPATAEQLKNSTIIVIDDVITTGSTMKEAMETLRQNGFERVYGLSLAH